ncbi:aspartic peptidase domain-containing protein [Irpex rosettiformis]|uniref:Aspartic peptidase domain-containing protein n=1 Tax=Irpex rosettiformis TaxID=378272 RepID=A0ACB8TVY3_9APHY|nr:aspartic peptidase domain-containing protein [Irpex rosettiformis]
MIAFSLLAALAVLDECMALGGLQYIRPPSPLPSVRSVAYRNSLASVVKKDVVNVGNSTSANTTSASPNAAIIPVVYSPVDQTYYSVISTGNASFRVALDSASADFWLVSSACKDKACSVPRYQLGYESSTFTSVNGNQTAFNVSFADSTAATGFVALESIQVANMTVPQQAIGLVKSSNVTFNNDVSGVLGLGFPRLSRIFSSLANGTGTPFFATMAQQGQLAYPLFGLSLTLNSSGSLTLGAVDGSVVTNLSLIQWTEVVPFAPFLGSADNTSSYLQWSIPLSGIQVNGTTLVPQPTYPNATSNSSLALFDAGTSGIFGPYQDVSRIFSSIAGSRLVDSTTGQWVVPCDTSETISFQFSGNTYLLQPTDYLIGPASSSPDLCLSWPRASQPSSDGIDWQLGSPFLRTVYSVYSFGIDRKEPPMIGLYPLRNATAPPQSADVVNAFFSTASAAVTTNLPNVLLPTPSSLSVPPYTFNASITAAQGKVVSTGLATSTYSPVLVTSGHPNRTAILTVSPSPTVFTFVVTTNGELVTSISSAATPSLGQPPGWTSGAGRPVAITPTIVTLLAGLLTAWTILTRIAL